MEKFKYIKIDIIYIALFVASLVMFGRPSFYLFPLMFFISCGAILFVLSEKEIKKDKEMEFMIFNLYVINLIVLIINLFLGDNNIYPIPANIFDFLERSILNPFFSITALTFLSLYLYSKLNENKKKIYK